MSLRPQMSQSASTNVAIASHTNVTLFPMRPQMSQNHKCRKNHKYHKFYKITNAANITIVTKITTIAMFSSQNQFLQNVILVGFSYRLSELFKLLYIGHNNKLKPLLLLWSTDIFTLVTHTVRPIIHILLFTVYPYTHRFNAARLLLCCCFVRLLFYQKQFK